MKTSFEIIKHNKIDSNGYEREYYTIKKKFLGIAYSVTSADSILGSDTPFPLITTVIFFIHNVLFFIGFCMNDYLIPLNWSIGLTMTSIYITYRMSINKFNSLYNADDYIKTYLKKKKFKSSSESVFKYNIDTSKGVYEKEVTVKQLN